jgi:hypothetical protein
MENECDCYSPPPTLVDNSKVHISERPNILHNQKYRFVAIVTVGLYSSRNFKIQIQKLKFPHLIKKSGCRFTHCKCNMCI